MITLVYDTETTGLTNNRAPVTDPSQPHLVQLAAILYDEERRPLFKLSCVVKSEIPIPAQASAVHGITDKISAQFGWPANTALRAFSSLLARADIAIAHNKAFDELVFNANFARHDVSYSWPQTYCTMEGAKDIVKCPPTPKMLKAGFNKFKSPTLTETTRFFFDEELSGAHDALIDTEACARIYFHMLDNGLV